MSNLTEKERDELVVAMYDPLSKMIKDHIASLFEYFEKNKDTMKETIIRASEGSTEPHAQLTVANPDKALLALFMSVLETGLEKYEIAIRAVNYFGQAGLDWNGFYAKWQEAQLKVKTINNAKSSPMMQ